MKIAFATIYDLRDVRRGSGTYLCLARELERQGHSVHYLGPFEDLIFPLPTRLFRRLARSQGRRYSSWKDPFMGRRLGRAVRAKLRDLQFDIALTNDYSIAAYTGCNQPLVLYTDDIFLLDYSQDTNPMRRNYSAFSVRFSQHVTRLGLRRASLCFFPTSWAADEALHYREKPKEQIGIIPFGANLVAPPISILERRSFQKIIDRKRFRLLFIGRDWVGKGGDVALQAVAELRRRGLEVTLDVVGSSPPAGQICGDSVTCHGLIDKTLESGRQKLHELLLNSDGFILPTLGEGFGIAAIEAAAYGIPTLAYRSVGISEAVRDGVTGVLVARGAPGCDFANIVQSWFSHPDGYDSLCRQARAHFDTTTNWERAASRLIGEIQSRLLFGRAPLVTGGHSIVAHPHS